MNTNDDKKNTTEETISHLPEENLNDVQGGNNFDTSLRRKYEQMIVSQEKDKNRTIEKHNTGASGSW